MKIRFLSSITEYIKGDNMKFAIHHNEDMAVVEHENFTELIQIVQRETKKRNWLDDNCWSEPLDEAAKQFSYKHGDKGG
jgi:hypothetical protein